LDEIVIVDPDDPIGVEATARYDRMGEVESRNVKVGNADEGVPGLGT